MFRYLLNTVSSESALLTLAPDTLLPPVVMHTSHPAETHYFPLVPVTQTAQRILLHTHATAPYVPQTPGGTVGTNIVIYSSGRAGCMSDLEALYIELDWPATVGRWASRYPTTLACWAVGIVALVLFRSWGVHDKGGTQIHCADSRKIPISLV